MNDEQLKNIVATLNSREEELLKALREANQKANKKDLWDKLTTLTPFLSSVLIASIGLYFTITYNRQANRIAELQTMGGLISQLTGPEENKKIAKQIIKTLGSPELANTLTDIAMGSESEERKIARAALGATAVEVFNNTNGGAVENGASSPVFTIARPHLITNIFNYHWNSGQGAKPGKIWLRQNDGTEFGPWEVTASSGQGGAPNVNWEYSPNVTIPAGTYTVMDSDPGTWSQNVQTKGIGFSRVKGAPIDSANR